jgi:hypothetical protein
MGRWRPSGWRLGAPAVAVLAVLAVAAAGCTIRARPEPTPTSVGSRPVAATTTTGPVSHGVTIASRAFTLVRGESRAQLGPAGPGALPVAVRGPDEDDADQVDIVLVFALMRTPPPCVRQVELRLRVVRFDYPTREPDLAAYPSSLVSLVSARPATRVGSETLLDNRPRGVGSLTQDRDWLHFDITERYRTWAEGGPFPSLDRAVPQGTPLVVDVRATDWGQPLFEARVAPIGGDRSAAPQLRWTVVRDC